MSFHERVPVEILVDSTSDEAPLRAELLLGKIGQNSLSLAQRSWGLNRLLPGYFTGFEIFQQIRVAPGRYRLVGAFEVTSPDANGGAVEPRSVRVVSRDFDGVEVPITVATPSGTSSQIPVCR